jgi:hypothetical protein
MELDFSRALPQQGQPLVQGVHSRAWLGAAGPVGARLSGDRCVPAPCLPGDRQRVTR